MSRPILGAPNILNISLQDSMTYRGSYEINIADIVPPNTMIKLERLRKTATLSVLIMMEPANRPKQPKIAKIVDIDIFYPQSQHRFNEKLTPGQLT
jgi:hypothetical protein